MPNLKRITAAFVARTPSHGPLPPIRFPSASLTYGYQLKYFGELMETLVLLASQFYCKHLLLYTTINLYYHLKRGKYKGKQKNITRKLEMCFVAPKLNIISHCFYLFLASVYFAVTSVPATKGWSSILHAVSRKGNQN